jgi:hypothetical protein
MKLHDMLVAEGLKISARMVRREVAEWKRQRQEVFVPLVYHPGDLAEVDFFEVLVDVGGQRQKAWMFLLRLMYSGRDFAWLYPRQDQVCFLDGHVRAVRASGVGAAPGGLRQPQAGGHARAGGLGAGACTTVSGARYPLRARAVLRSAADRTRQGRRRSARQGRTLAAAGADSLGARPRERQP